MLLAVSSAAIARRTARASKAFGLAVRRLRFAGFAVIGDFVIFGGLFFSRRARNFCARLGSGYGAKSFQTFDPPWGPPAGIAGHGQREAAAVTEWTLVASLLTLRAVAPLGRHSRGAGADHDA